MSRTNISILLATALLGVLLWIVISIVRDLARAPDSPLPLPTEPAVIEFDPALPRITSRPELEDWLKQLGYTAADLIGSYSDWLAARGFHNQSPLLGVGNKLHATGEYAGQDDATLLILAGKGDTGAMHALAERSLETDPLAALEWFDQAIVNGSIYAMIRTADLLTTLGDPGLAGFSADTRWQTALQTVQAETPQPLERALAWSIAAITVGGYAVMDAGHANRVVHLGGQLDAAGIERACTTAQDYVLAAAAARRAQGGAVFSTQSPPLALSVARPEMLIPCDVPVIPLVTLSLCLQKDFVGPGSRLHTAWLCTDPG